ncbi:uncharacterized protein LOC129956570 [Argiope bruennichi]|uniref:uncharacterized protein LOC129956570 n=1 Tax=Argiope bruennichi TaxID=94029 RepID=UPI00249588ED|nr:uncharacterized protein LOC129956570 [Argiope bruennichi]
MIDSPLASNTASSVARVNKGRDLDLGRGSRPINVLQSPPKTKRTMPLRILQCNINGLCTSATRAKLDHLLKLADQHRVQIIALQETKYKTAFKLKLKGFNIFRKDRLNRGGGGLALLIRKANFQVINIGQLHNDCDLEIQGISLNWNGEPIKIFNTYLPPNGRGLCDGLSLVTDEQTFILGEDLNAKHTSWGCSTSNQIGVDLSNFIDDKAFMCINDGSPTHSSYSYATNEALDVSFVSADLFPKCKWEVLENIGSDHLPILIELNQSSDAKVVERKYWNFKKANWDLYGTKIAQAFEQVTPCTELEGQWSFFRETIISAAKAAIPRGNIKDHHRNFADDLSVVEPLILKRNDLSRELFEHNNISVRIELNRVNAEIKQLYARARRKRWTELCENIDVGTSNTKLWKLAKAIDREQPQYEKSNCIDSKDTSLPLNDRDSADTLGRHYCHANDLEFVQDDKFIAVQARKTAHRCRQVK